MMSWDSRLSLQSLDVALSVGAILTDSCGLFADSCYKLYCNESSYTQVILSIFRFICWINSKWATFNQKSKGICKIATTGLLGMGPWQLPISLEQFIFTGILERVQRPGTATWETWTGHVELSLAPRMQSAVLQPHHRAHGFVLIWLVRSRYSMLFESLPPLFRVRSNACHMLKVNHIFLLSSSLLPVFTVLLAVLFLPPPGALPVQRKSVIRENKNNIVGLCPWILTNSFLEFPNCWSDENVCSGGMPLTAPLLCTKWLQVGARLHHMGTGNEKEQIDGQRMGTFTPPPSSRKEKRLQIELNKNF